MQSCNLLRVIHESGRPELSAYVAVVPLYNYIFCVTVFT